MNSYKKVLLESNSMAACVPERNDEPVHKRKPLLTSKLLKKRVIFFSACLVGVLLSSQVHAVDAIALLFLLNVTMQRAEQSPFLASLATFPID